jgi:hypothetical protein
MKLEEAHAGAMPNQFDWISPYHMLQPPAEGPEKNAAALRSTVSEVNEKLALEVGGLLFEMFEAPRLHDDRQVDHLHFRSKPLPSLAGGELRFDLSSADLGNAELGQDLLYAARSVSGCRSAVSQSVAELRRVVQAAIARHPCTDVPVRRMKIGVRATPTLLACFDGVVEMEILGHDLMPTVARVQGAAFRHLEEKLDALLAMHRRRVELLASLRETGDRGLIEEPARRVLHLSGLKLNVALKGLKRRSSLDLEYCQPDGRIVASLYWREGVLKANLGNYGTGLSLIDGVIYAWKTLPAEVVASRPGKRLGRLIRDPHLSPELMVLAATRLRRETRLTLDIPAVPFSA